MNLILFLNIIIIQICDIFKYKYSLNTCHLVNVRQNGGERCVHSGTMEAHETTWVSRDFLIVFCTAGLRKARSVSSEEAAKEGAEFFFNFIFFFRFIKNICLVFYFQKCHPAADSSGGRLLPPDEPAVGSFRAGPWWAEPQK